MSTYMPGAVFTNNAIAGPWPTSGGATTSMYSNYPGNFFPASLDAVGFLDRAHDNYRLSSGSPFKGKATDGTDLGVDFDALDAAQSGTNAPPPPPPSSTPHAKSDRPDSVPDTVSDTARNTAPDAGTYILAASGDRHDGTHHFDRRPSIGRDRERRAAGQRDGRG